MVSATHQKTYYWRDELKKKSKLNQPLPNRLGVIWFIFPKNKFWSFKARISGFLKDEVRKKPFFAGIHFKSVKLHHLVKTKPPI